MYKEGETNGNHLKLLDSLLHKRVQHNHDIASLACCHGLCLDEIHVAGHQPHSVD